MKTAVAIIGAGPSGMLLARLLHLAGIESAVIERRARTYVEGRIRAGVLEQGSADVLAEAGLDVRLKAQGLRHDGIRISHDGRSHRIDFADLTGKAVTVYGQTEVQKDLGRAADESGQQIFYEAANVTLTGLEADQPSVTFLHEGQEKTVKCDYIAGCDGFRGVSRQSIPPKHLTLRERVYPFAWLGILAETPPVADELVYARGVDGFALFSMRSETVSRLYLQCAPDEDLANWPDERVFEALRARLDPETAAGLKPAPSLEKSVTAMRSFVSEPMRFGRLFLAGDAAHIVPPTGAKGLNLAIADVYRLSRALIHTFRTGDNALLAAYSDAALARVWKAQRFSWWMTTLLHRNPHDDDYGRRVQQAELDYLLSSRAQQTALAENYVGLPLEH